MNLGLGAKALSVLLFIAAVALIAWLLFLDRAPASLPDKPEQPGQAEAQPSGGVGLGAQLYEQSQNPVKDKLPEPVSPLPNPIEEAYRNPFE